jgi:hypothetical protein
MGKGVAAKGLIALRHLAIVAIISAFPIPWHEVMGHGLVGVLCGGRVTKFQLLGWQFLPEFKWTGTAEGLGVCDHIGIQSKTCMHLTELAGSMNTFLVAAAAAWILWRFRPCGVKLTALVCLSIWSLDLLTFTLPSFGVRRYIWSGTRYSEPYHAAVALGIPGPLFQVLVLTGFLAVGVLVGLALARPSPRSR